MTIKTSRGDNSGGGGGAVDSVTGTLPIAVDNSDPANPVVEFTQISEALVISLHTLTSFTNNVGNVLEGSTINDVTLDWTYNRNGDDPFSQTIDQGVGAVPVADRQIILGPALGIVADTTYQIDAVGDDQSYGAPVGNPSSRTTTIDFQPAYYFGVSQNLYATGAGIEGDAAIFASESLGNSRQRTYNFDASVGGGANYLYIAYPTAQGNPASTQLGGFNFNDYTLINDDITNSAGFLRNYIILRSNNTYNGANINWEIF